LTPTPLFDGAKEWLNGRRQSIVEVRTPSRGDLVTLQNLATQNAEAQLSKFIDKASGSLEQKAANDGAEVLEMEKLNHIVCFDMAQLIGENRVGASVSFRNGRPEKKEYRRYTVKGEAIDDLRMMSEVVERWLKRQDEWPDLLLLDGGETHLNTIYEVLKDNDLHDQINLAAIAKREETLFRLEKEPIILDRKGRVLVHARDEAHRFVNTFHRKQRNRNKINDPLQEVLGLGAKKMQTLLRHFGGRKGVEHASIKDLQTVPGIGNSLAERIFQSINP
jgi:excinuclease ABC subunit C